MFDGVQLCFRCLPGVVAYALADVFAAPVVLVSWFREQRVGRGVNRNLRIVYRDTLTARMALRMRWAWARHMAWLAVDFFRMPKIHKSNLKQFVDTTELDDLRARCDASKGLICVTGHIGVPELLGHVAGLSGLPVTSLFRPRSNPAIEERVTRIRACGGQKALPKWNSLWPLKKALDRGEFLGMAMDEYTRERPVFVPFLGTLAATNCAAAHLHLRTGAPMVVVSVHRVARQWYRFHVWDLIHHPRTEDRNGNVKEVLVKMNEAMSRAIRAYPAQWFWGGRRFRNRPPGEVPGPDGLPPQSAWGRDADRVPSDPSQRECAWS